MVIIIQFIHQLFYLLFPFNKLNPINSIVIIL